MTTKHTPTPWHQEGVQIHDAAGEVIIGASYGINRKADTPFIVRACNSHDALVEALETARLQCVLWQGEPNEFSCSIHTAVINEIDTALALAKGE